MVVATVAVVSVGALVSPAPATAAPPRTCETGDGRYQVTPPPAGSDSGADPAAVAAADCTLGFDEQNVYPLSVIGLCLIATVVTLVLVRRGTTHDVIGSGA
jgi:hypothetical protein